MTETAVCKWCNQGYGDHWGPQNQCREGSVGRYEPSPAVPEARTVPGIQVKVVSKEYAISGLNNIFNALQKDFHDQWDWMKANFYLEVLKAELARAEATIAELAGWMERELAGPFIIVDDDYKCRFCLQTSDDFRDFPHSSPCSYITGLDICARATGKESQ